VPAIAAARLDCAAAVALVGCMMWFFRIAGFASLVGAIAFSNAFAPSIAWENGPIENLQVVLLLVGAAIAFRYQATSRIAAHAWYWRCGVVIWLCLAGRELGWGANFYPPTQTLSSGQPIHSSHLLPFIGVVHMALVILAVAMLAAAVRYRFWRIPGELFRQGGVPWLEIAIVALGAALSLAVDGSRTQLRFMVGSGAEVFEELAELAAYAFFASAQVRIREVLR
jgi:hypothetical protein